MKKLGLTRHEGTKKIRPIVSSNMTDYEFDLDFKLSPNKLISFILFQGVAAMNSFLGDSKLFHCEFCSVPFSTVRSLNMHKTKSHGPNMTSQEFSKPLVVDISKIKSEQLDLDTYIKKQYSMETTKDKCSFCSVRFTTKQTMKVGASYLVVSF